MWFKLLKVCTIDQTRGIQRIESITSGFFRSISLRNKDALQDTLRLLTLWFKYGAHENISHAMASGFSTVEVDTWLEVIPQVCPVNLLDVHPPSEHARLSHEFKPPMPIFEGTSTIS
jgi:hypothetical protein